ncbi:MAG: hypothetical protein H6R10_1796 [Rhodocyclaceae bacterium]|nr:hypothetical protein [Rhodocyclaceae bacterium]
MNMDNNPFKAPEARVADVFPGTGEFIPEGQRVPAGNGIGWFGRGWEMFRAAPGTWIGLSLILLVITLILGMIPLVNFLLNLIVPIFIGGIMIGCKAQEEGEELRIVHLFAGFSGYAGKLALVGVAYLVGVLLIVLATVVVAGGLGGIMIGTGKGSATALALPMLMAAVLFAPLAMAVWYAPALVVFHDVAPVAALKSSFFACLKNFMPFLVYGFVFLVLALVASLPVFLGWLVLIPVVQASMYASYRDMFTRS